MPLGMDCLGAAECPKDYVVGGTAANEMHGLSEALWHEDMVIQNIYMHIQLIII